MGQVETEKRRGAILKHLSLSPGGQLSLDLLKSGCAAQGIPSNLDQIENALNWLSDNDLARMNTLGSMKTGVIQPDGREVVEGLRTISGVLSPGGVA